MMASGNSSLTASSPTACGRRTSHTMINNTYTFLYLQHKHHNRRHTLFSLSGGHCAVCGVTAHYLVPQVFGRAAYVSVEVRHVDELGDAGLFGCPGNMLRDGDEDILVAIVPVHNKRKKPYM